MVCLWQPASAAAAASMMSMGVRVISVRQLRDALSPSRPCPCIMSMWDIALSIRMAHQAGNSAQRIRIGLTSLALVFLIVLIASAITRASRNDSGKAVNQAMTNEPSEPLAELGVTPGASDSDNNTTPAK